MIRPERKDSTHYLYYVFAALANMIGVIIFQLFETKEHESMKNDTSNWRQFTGIGLLLFSLTMDGALGAIQDQIRDVYSSTSRQMMLSMTAYGCIFSSALWFWLRGRFSKCSSLLFSIRMFYGI